MTFNRALKGFCVGVGVASGLVIAFKHFKDFRSEKTQNAALPQSRARDVASSESRFVLAFARAYSGSHSYQIISAIDSEASNALPRYMGSTSAIDPDTRSPRTIVESLPEVGRPVLLTNLRTGCELICLGVSQDRGRKHCRMVNPTGFVDLLPLEEVFSRSEYSMKQLDSESLVDRHIRFRFEGLEFTIDRLWYDFGNLAKSETKHAEFNIENVGPTEFSIGECASSCGCVAVSLKETEIAKVPPAKAKLIAVDVTVAPGKSLRQTVSFTLFPKESGSPIRIEVPIVGTSFEMINWTPHRLDFGVCSAKDTKPIERSIRFSATHSDPARILTINVEGDLKISTQSRTELTNEGIATYYISCTTVPADAEAGSYEGAVCVTTSSRATPEIKIPFKFDVR